MDRGDGKQAGKTLNAEIVGKCVDLSLKSY